MAQENFDFFTRITPIVVAIISVMGAFWGYAMKHVRLIAKDEASKAVLTAIDARLINVASKTAVEEVRASTQKITERIDELFTLLVTRQGRRDDIR
ncbi:hypothetical protein UFOVP1082_37 [uncultured Caudovirales phage]|uniref:Uncharacterized protein n=1 Tax=uncultured Caudovirales phage TaxID=2100421 RepID=A0A6J5QI75_9CAUD|nr:hypothetical protein UFOVP906_15 [uncultured Caudovirales phage]CAB4176554.1 hypothetical protein UFOVP992_41 [uncultured Caudovirales phage]CAB4183402.1 hypothetical protein UFOVP1082_37 [uncultured Caudovirales phage]CAB4197435.1 hypothetical protein UFOVP1322_22 [uncultured Caudovirales phage]CAB4212818.1 hypothetical protein UFOVP1434_44 [uncultured Caudovirales phage]